MNKTAMSATLQTILQLVIPYIKKLIESTVIPLIKRQLYEKLDKKADALIEDLAQNAAKIKDEKNPAKKASFIEGTKLGIETLKAIAQKLNQAADEISKSIQAV